MGESCVLGNRVVDPRVNSFSPENCHSSCLTTVWKMAEVVDAQTEESPANVAADELKTGSADPGT